MSCCDGWPAAPEDTVAKCKDCEGEIDKAGYSTEEGCNYGRVACDRCGYQPCDQGC